MARHNNSLFGHIIPELKVQNTEAINCGFYFHRAKSE